MGMCMGRVGIITDVECCAKRVRDDPTHSFDMRSSDPAIHDSAIHDSAIHDKKRPGFPGLWTPLVILVG